MPKPMKTDGLNGVNNTVIASQREARQRSNPATSQWRRECAASSVRWVASLARFALARNDGVNKVKHMDEGC